MCVHGFCYISGSRARDSTPSEITPTSAYYLTKIIEEAGLPAGVFNLLGAKGKDVGEALVSHPAVAGISFTGSIPTGRKIAQGAIQHMKKIQMEMGGKLPIVNMQEADFDFAFDAAFDSDCDFDFDFDSVFRSALDFAIVSL